MKNNFICSEYVEHSANDSKQYTLYIENQMMEYVITGKPQKLINLLYEITDKHVSHGQMAYSDLRSMKNVFISASAIARHRCILAGLDPSLAGSLADQYSVKVEKIDSIEEIELMIFQVLYEYAKQMAKLTEYTGSTPITREVISYVTSHIYEKLSVHVLATHLNYSCEHLCRVFKNETNETISHYINRTKINEAKPLLRYTNDSLLDISSRLQYSSQSYFQNVFKSMEHMTPAQYRNTTNSLDNTFEE